MTDRGLMILVGIVAAIIYCIGSSLIQDKNNWKVFLGQSLMVISSIGLLLFIIAKVG